MHVYTISNNLAVPTFKMCAHHCQWQEAATQQQSSTDNLVRIAFASTPAHPDTWGRSYAYHDEQERSGRMNAYMGLLHAARYLGFVG